MENLALLIAVFITCIAGIRATFDLSNVDLVNFQYFKYPKTTVRPFYFQRLGQLYSIRKIPDRPSKIESTVSHAKAVFKYLKGLTFGTTEERIRSSMILDPDFGKKFAETFQSKHGKFGDKLVDLLGSGPTREELVDQEVIDYREHLK